MGAGKHHTRRKAEIRAASQIAPVVQMEQRREERSMYGRDAPPATLQKWRGEAWGTYAWADIVGIMQAAEIAGATENWARLTRRMYQDGHILAVRGTRIDPIASADFDVSPGGTEQIDAQAALDVEAMLRGLPDLPTTLDAVLDAEFVGWSVEEIIWGVRGAWVWPESIDILEPHRFRFDNFLKPYLYDDGRLGNDPSANPQIRLVGKALRENKFIVHMPRTIPDYPIASGLLRGVARYWWVKWMAAQYWLNGAEVAGNPRAIGKYPQEAPDNIKQAFFDQLQQLSASGVMVMSKDNELEIVSAGAQGTGGVWQGIQTWCDDGITKTVLGSTLNTSVGDSGSRALGESQGERTIDPRLKKSSAAMWATITRDLIRPFLEFNVWNYGGRMPKLPVVKSRFGEEMEPKPDELLVDVGGVTIDELRRVAGLPEWGAERGGDALAKRADAAAAPAFGMPATADAPDVAATALNGAQIASLQELLAAVQGRTMAPDAAKVAIRNAFPSISAEDAAAMVDAQSSLPPVSPDGQPMPPAPAAGVTAAAAMPPRKPEPGAVWVDTEDGHRLRVVAVEEGKVFFVDLDGPNPARQWTWREATFIERASPPEPVIPAGIAGQLNMAPAETVHASGGTPPASPFQPWDLVERMTREAE